MNKLEKLKKTGIHILRDEQALVITGGETECCGTQTSKRIQIDWYSDSHNDWKDEGCCGADVGTGGSGGD